MWIPAQPPTWGRYFIPHLTPGSVLAMVSILVLVLYLAGFVRLRSQGIHWSIWRTLSFTAGSLSLFYVTGTWFNGYSMALFGVHMAQHMVLTMVTPILYLTGSPMTLALRALPRGTGTAGVPRALLLELLHSRLMRFVSHPGFTLPLFLVSLYGVYFTPIFDDLMRSDAGHEFMLIHFLITGLLFFGPILGQDPWPSHGGYPARILELAAPMPFHAFFGIAIMMSDSLIVRTFAHPPAGWGINVMADQTTAGSIAWSFGELPNVAVMAVVLFSWMASEERRGRAMERAAERTGDAELEAYNARLRAMAAHQD